MATCIVSFSDAWVNPLRHYAKALWNSFSFFVAEIATKLKVRARARARAGGGGVQSVAHDVRFVEFVSVISFGSYSMFRIGSFFDSWHRLANTFKRELTV